MPKNFFRWDCSASWMVRFIFTLTSLGIILPAVGAERSYYQEPTWKPRAILPAADALKGDFWPASPKTKVDYEGPGFENSRLAELPPPGVHPRVLVTPSDVEKIRAKVALGDKAPQEFRTLWERTTQARSAFYALVTKDEVLGKQLAAQLVEKMKALEPKLDKLDAQPDRDNLWAVERSIVASGDPSPPTEIWALLDYDYLHGWMTPDEREMARRIITRLTAGRISNFMTYPDHFLINNHQGFGMEFFRLLLLIEGEKGYDPAVFKLGAKKARAMLDWFLSEEGMCYESIKGWLNTSAFVAVGLRQRDLLKHSHLRAKMRFFQAAMRWENGQWQIRDEMRASAFHVIWMMHYFYPQNEGYDLLYSASLASSPFVMDAKAKWPDPVGISMELLLLYAGGAMVNKEGQPLDWKDQARIDALKLPITWKDDVRGYVETRNTWGKADLHLGFTCKQDFFYGGHEGSENNRLTLWHGGVNWIRDLNMLAVKATFLQNMLTVNGQGLSWPPAPGLWMGVRETPGGVTAVGDGKIGYSYAKVMQVHPLDFPSAQLPYYAPFAEGNYDLTRDLQVAFHPDTVKWNDGYAHTDYGPWSGETRLVEHYRVNNPMEQAYRTVHLARGENPYVLVIDDARKDGLKHLFEWNISLPEDVELVENKTAEISFQKVEPNEGRETDLLLTRPNTPRDPQTGKLLINKGDPLCLVRVLWRNSPYGFPVPRFERMHGSPERPFARFSHLTIPAISESPEFRILVYPHYQGDPLPVTKWNKTRTELTVQIKEQKDLYRFAQADGGRTVFAMTRNQKPVIDSGAAPARPLLEVRGQRLDVNDWRTTREEGKVPEYPFGESMTAALVRPAAPVYLVYTLDGSEPKATSARYEAPLSLTRSTTLKAKQIDPSWPGAQRESATLTARFVQRPVVAGLATAPEGSQAGVLARVYEKKTVMWNDRGFFEASKIMLPDLRPLKPLLTTATTGFQLPHVVPSRPMKEQVKGFYRFSGLFHAPAAGVYGFAVDSCGPVLFDIAQQNVLASVGVFHQQQAVRTGEAVLGAGWQPFELTVCDPLFWNLTTTDPMPFTVKVRREGGEYATVPAESLRVVAAGETLTPAPALVWKEAQKPPGWLEPGAILSFYERDGKNLEPDYLDLEGLTPLRAESADQLETNLKPGLVRRYEAWFQAPVDGVYRFNLPARRSANAGLGELRSAYQNQLRIDEEIVVQRGIAGRFPTRELGLKAGWHALSLRLGASPAVGTVTYPDGQSLPLTAALLSRPVQVEIRPQTVREARSLYEIYGATPVVMALPEGRVGEIRFTQDGREPTAKDPLFSGSISLTDSTTVTATVFVKGQAMTLPARVQFQKVNVPEFDCLGRAIFSQWNGKAGITELDPQIKFWIAPGTSLMAGRDGQALAVNRQSGGESEGQPKAVDVNLTRGLGQAGFKVTGMRMKENALTVGLWFLSDKGEGKIFGKDGYSAFGKSYKTVSCVIEKGGRLRVGPNRISGGQIKPGTWNQVVLTADEEAICLYLNGEKVAEGEGSQTINTDALDFFSDHSALVERVALYNRVLSPADVAQWFNFEKR